MNYELCKELTDAGFPGERTPWTNPDGSVDDRSEIPVVYPTLSALIEACGEEFIHLKVKNDALIEPNNPMSWWEAEGLKLGNQYLSGARTPEEAVARLWLALNKPLENK